MSLKIMSQVWPLQIGHADKLVLLALADNANDEGQCWPSVSTLCEKTCLSDRAIQHSVRRLTEAGHISVTRRYKKSNVFDIHPVLYPERRSPEAPSPENPSPERNDISTPNDVHPLKTEPSKKNRQGHAPASGLDETAWKTFVAYRVAIRRPLKPASIPAAQRKLAAFGVDQAAVVEQTIANGWQGLFALKDAPAPGVAAKDWRQDPRFKNAV